MSIDLSDDGTIRNAVIFNLVLEGVVMLASIAVMMSETNLMETITRNVKRDYTKWRSKFLGPVPLEEDDIKRYEKLTVIEAMRIVRQAEK